jgi:lipid A 3-O-deacylase
MRGSRRLSLGRSRRDLCRRLALAGIAAALAFLPAALRAQNVVNLTFGQIKLGAAPHDVNFLGGKEHGVDFNPEVIMPSPVADAWAATLPAYLRWLVQPRPTFGAEVNSSHYTDQFYFGAKWSWMLANNILQPGDGFSAGIFFGGAANDGQIIASKSDRKSLGSHILFREELEFGYWINPMIEISAFLDHVSNAGFAKQNQSINDVGARIGFRF